MTLAAMKMSDQTRKDEPFRSLYVPGTPLVFFNIWDAGSAKANGKTCPAQKAAWGSTPSANSVIEMLR